MTHAAICQSCALDGFTTPATHNVNGLTLCTHCLQDAHHFAGYKSWPFETKIARINLLIDLAFPPTRKEETLNEQLDNVVGW